MVQEPNVVVVDDLDPGFSIVHSSDLEYIQSNSPTKHDSGSQNALVQTQYYLPEFPEDFRANEWHRVMDGWGFGKYRQTLTRIKNGQGLTSAKFETSLPQLGTWRLEYYVSQTHLKDLKVLDWYGLQINTERKYYAGDIVITVHNSTNESTTTFNFVGLDHGWQRVGEFDLVEDSVAVLVSDATDGTQGNTVYADAIRWTYQSEITKEESAQQ